MHLQQHALVSWLIAEAGPGTMARRDRALVLLAGLAPDLDALTLLFGVEAYQKWHHLVLHNVAGAAGTVLVCAAFAGQRPAVALLAAAAFHAHLVCDLLGSGGPDGSIWPIPYFAPFHMREYSYGGQWGLGSWQNVAIMVALVAAAVHLAKRRGRSIVEAISPRADAAVVAVFRRRWPL